MLLSLGVRLLAGRIGDNNLRVLVLSILALLMLLMAECERDGGANGGWG